jgi:hypothetical protein
MLSYNKMEKRTKLILDPFIVEENNAMRVCHLFAALS